VGTCTSLSCGAYVCGPDASTCLATCTSNQQCASGYNCTNHSKFLASVLCMSDFLRRVWHTEIKNINVCFFGTIISGPYIKKQEAKTSSIRRFLCIR